MSAACADHARSRDLGYRVLRLPDIVGCPLVEVFLGENLDEPKRHYLLGSDAINTYPTKPIFHEAHPV